MLRLSAGSRLRRGVGAGLAAAAGLVLAACASAAPAATPEGGGAATMTEANFAEVIADSFAEVRTMQMEMTISAPGLEGVMEPVIAELDLTGGETQMRMTMSMEGIDVTALVIDRHFYLNMGELSGGMYLRLSDEEAGEFPGLGELFGAFEVDPAAQAIAFADAISSLEESGTDVVDGTEVTLFTLALDTAQITPGAIGVDPAELSSIEALTVVYGLDAAGHVRMIDLVMADHDREAMTVATRISRINEPITITRPDPAMVMDGADLLF